jgi:hypothetical protein
MYLVLVSQPSPTSTPSLLNTHTHTLSLSLSLSLSLCKNTQEKHSAKHACEHTHSLSLSLSVQNTHTVFFVVFFIAKIGDDPREGLANFGYKLNTKVTFFSKIK